MPHIVVAGALHPSGLKLLENLRARGFTHDYDPGIREETYAPLMERADALVIRTQPLTAATIDRAKNLRIVSRHGVGYDAVDLPALDARGIPLAIVGDVNSAAVAEHSMMLLLACSRRAVRADAAVREGRWAWRNELEATELDGRRLLIMGYGRIGRHVARMARAFNMDVTAHDPFLEKQGWPEGPARPAGDLHAALAEADCVSINMPKGEKPAIGAEEIAVLKPGAILVNTARGGIIDEAALRAGLQSGQVAAAGLDVFEDEPPAPDHPLLAFDQVILSPHIAGLTDGAAERMALTSIRNVVDFFDGTLDPALVVNRETLHA